LVVTRVSPHKKLEHITNSLNKILHDNNQVSQVMKLLIQDIIKNSSLHLFHRPSAEGEYNLANNLLATLEETSNYTKIPENSANITLSKDGVQMAEQLLNIACNNINSLVNLVKEAVIKPDQFTKEDNILVKPHNELIVPFLPQHPIVQSSIEIPTQNYLPNLLQLKKLAKIFTNNEKLNSLQDGIDMLREALNLMAQFVDINAANGKILQDYAYILSQQYEYIKFFTEVSKINCSEKDFEKIEQKALTHMQDIVINCKKMLNLNMEHQVTELKLIDSTHDVDAEYYSEVIKYFELYPESQICQKKIAQVHIYLAQMAYDKAQSFGQNDNDNQNSDSVITMHYSQALSHDKELPEIYGKLGSLLTKQGKYDQAIECYKILNDSYHVNKCFKDWIVN